VDFAHGIDPTSQKFVLAWPLLSSKQKKVLTGQLAEFLKENKVGRFTNRFKSWNE
jgi:hypothetical protein